MESILSSRVESILEVAEQAAAGIREDAQQRASRYLEESHRQADEIAPQRIREISDLTDALVQRVRAVAQQSDELIAALDDAGRRVVNQSLTGAAGGEGPPTQPSFPQQPADLSQASPPPHAAAPPPSQPIPQRQPIPEGARLLATQMMVAGGSREEIVRRLREEFGLQDPTPILQEIGL